MSPVVSVKTETNTYLSELLEQLTYESESNNLKQLRQKAVSVVERARIPNKNDEDWRFTDVSGLLDHDFKLGTVGEVSTEILEEYALVETSASRIVFINGYYSPQLSNISALPATVYAGNLARLDGVQKEKIVKNLETKGGSEEVFTELNTAGLNDGAVIWLKVNAIGEIPIQIIHLSLSKEHPTFSQPRTIIIAERNSSAQIIETYGIVGQEYEKIPYFTNTVTQIWLQENARINHTRVQKEAFSCFHISKTAVTQARDSHYTCNEISIGSKLYRHNLEIIQKGEQTETNLNGLITISGQQLADTHSRISLNLPHGTVDQLHKCIIGDRARAVFNGKILVPQQAQLTNAAQLNRNLLLSPKARVNTKPELRITADNVKCAHGATISQLEEDEIFYLRSRGLNETDAKFLLIDAFAAEIIDRISIESLRKRLTQCVACKTIN